VACRAEQGKGAQVDSIFRLMGMNLAVVATGMFLVWLLSLRLKDVSIVDIAWGASGALIAIQSFALADGYLARKLLLTGMVGFWGIRLALYIALRKRGHGEDFRYAAMRAEHGEGFRLRSLFTVFFFQTILIWTISIPVQLGQSSPTPATLGLLDYLGSGLWALGLVIEVVADGQLRTFLSDAGNKGRVMDRGLWRYSRHPNYFGESLIWWGVFLVAASVPWGWTTVVSPILMTYFLLKVSGVPMLEEALAERREGYREYMERTSGFVPWPPSNP
jgi:steroid 5-alpha reductase family enzyme